ncbi:MAG: hypothetical protein ACJAW2_000646 [Shewanella sp.]|jgi:hypothetical protein
MLPRFKSMNITSEVIAFITCKYQYSLHTQQRVKAMTNFRVALLISWILIMSITAYAIVQAGPNWPAIYFGDLFLGNPWRQQFNTDFLIHLFILCSWVFWREESKLKGAIYGFLSIIMGGMFGFMYILYASYQAKGNVSKILLGHHCHKLKKET